MSDTAASGSVAQDAASAGNLDTQQTATDNGSAGAAETPFSGLQDEGNRKWVEAKGTKTLDDLITSTRNLETKLGSSITRPADDAPKEEWDKFFSKLGRPESPDKYEFKRPEGLPENLPYSDDLANASKAWMHENGLTPKQAQAMHDHFVRFSAQQMEAQMKAVGQAVEQTFDTLTKEWGAKDSDGFKTKHELANRAIKNLGLVEAFQQSGILLQDGALTNPTIAKAFAEVGSAMYREDVIGGEQSASGANPFKPETRNVTEISRLVKNDPQRARRLAQEAGEKPEHWGIRG